MFQPFVDKENASQGTTAVSSFRPAMGHRSTAGKIFQGNASVPKPKGLVSRQALGDLKDKANQGVGLGGAQKDAKDGVTKEMMKPKKGLQKPASKQKTKEVTLPAKENILPDIESMHLYEDHVFDTYDDIWPVSERPGTYAAEFHEWRPCKLLGSYNEGRCRRDSVGSVEEDVDLHRDDEVQLEILPSPTEDVTIPPIDDLFVDDVDLYAGL